MFGYHVHEKAILNVLIPFSIIASAEPNLFILTLTAGTFSLFPLLFTPFEIALKLLVGTLHVVLSIWNLSPIKFHWIQELYLLGFLPMYVVENFSQFVLPKYAFLPLILVSDYCFLGICFAYLKFYWTALKSDYDVKLGWANATRKNQRQKKRQ